MTIMHAGRCLFLPSHNISIFSAFAPTNPHAFIVAHHISVYSDSDANSNDVRQMKAHCPLRHHHRVSIESTKQISPCTTLFSLLIDFSCWNRRDFLICRGRSRPTIAKHCFFLLFSFVFFFLYVDVVRH